MILGFILFKSLLLRSLGYLRSNIGLTFSQSSPYAKLWQVYALEVIQVLVPHIGPHLGFIDLHIAILLRTLATYLPL
jgi:hypothetical protein